MSQEIANLDAFKAERDPLLTELPPDESLAGGIGTAYAIIGYKGKTWSLRYRGETHLFKDKDGKLMPEIDVIILQAPPFKSKSYFPNYADGSNDPPLCASIDGITPDPDVEQMQAEACAICPHNEIKVLPNGHRGKECTDYKRLAVLLPPNVTERMFGEKLLEPVFLRVPPASLNSLALMDQKMGSKGLGRHYSSYLTRISFVQVNAKGEPLAYPQMKFYALRPLKPEELKPVLELRQDPQCKRITGEDGGGRGVTKAIAAPTHNAAAFIPQETAPKLIERLNTVETTTGTVETVEMVPAEEDMGFGSTTVAATTKSSSEAVSLGDEQDIDANIPARTTVVDTGEPEESDAELDARIDGILKKKK